MTESFKREPLPPEMYEGGFNHSADVIKLCIGYFGIESPAILYYPGSSTDVSFIGIDGVQTIHADLELSEIVMRGFESLGAEAHRVDVHDWQPGRQIDIVTFINPSGIDVASVLDNVQLSDRGLVIWASWGGFPPMSMTDYPAIEHVGVISVDEAGTVELDTQGLEDYFSPKDFASLTDAEQQEFSKRLANYLDQRNLKTDSSTEEAYEYLRLPDNWQLLLEMNYRFSYKKTGTFFVFQK